MGKEETYEKYKDILGLIKIKGDALSIAPERFNQMETRYYQPWKFIKLHILGYVVTENGFYCLIVKENDKHLKIPFARNKEWFQALISEPEFNFIQDLPQIYVTSVA